MRIGEALQQDDAGSLRKLNDIVVPDPVPFWPPAPGWYFVIGATVLAGLWFAWRRWRAWRAAAYRREATAELAGLSDRREWTGLSELLKRTALAAYPRADVAPLFGDDWLAFLDRTGNTREFTKGAGRHLSTLTFDPHASERVSEEEALQARDVCAAWIRSHGAQRGAAS